MIIEQSLPLKDVRLTRIEVLGDYLFKQVCDYVKVYDVLALNTSYVYFLESKNFAITIISVDLLDGTTRVHMEPMEISEGFLTKMWKEAIDKKKKKVDIRNIPGVTRGFPKQSKTLHTGGAQIEKFPRRM